MKGADAEDLACKYLKSQGLRLIVRNFRARGGELDLVMQDGEELAIIEVRKRSSILFGTAAESVDHRKQLRIITASRILLSKQPKLALLPARFDVVTVDADNAVEWIRAAFDIS